MKNIISIISIFFALNSVLFAQSTYNQELEQAAKEISQKITVSGKKNVAVLDFENSNNQISELGSWLASVFSTHLENNSANGFTVKNRSDIEKAIQQIKSESGSGAFDSKTIQRLGEISGSDVIVYGELTLMDDEITVNIRTKNTSLNSSIGGVIVSFTATDGMRTKYENYIENKETRPQSSVSSNSASGEGSERSSKNVNCKEQNTGDYCFTNKKSVLIEIYYKPKNSENRLYPYGRNQLDMSGTKITIEPGQTSCIYELGNGVYTYNYKDPTQQIQSDVKYAFSNGNNSNPVVISGEFFVERCKSKNFIIK
jgi:hypothetical protein